MKTYIKVAISVDGEYCYSCHHLSYEGKGAACYAENERRELECTYTTYAHDAKRCAQCLDAEIGE